MNNHAPYFTQAQKVRILVISLFQTTKQILPDTFASLSHRCLLRTYQNYPPLPSSQSYFHDLVYRWSSDEKLTQLAIDELANIYRQAKEIYDENNYSL